MHGTQKWRMTAKINSKETRKRKLAGEMTAKSRRRTTLKSNHFILVTRSATHCLPDTSTTHASVRSHIKKPASADSDGSASLPQNNPCSSTSLEMIFTASWALPALSRPSLQHACSICVLYIRHVPNIRFVFASVPNSCLNSVFVFRRIVSVTNMNSYSVQCRARDVYDRLHLLSQC